MRFLVKIVNIPQDQHQQQESEEHVIEAETHEEAITEAMNLCNVEGDTDDTLASWATPIQDRPEDTAFIADGPSADPKTWYVMRKDGTTRKLTEAEEADTTAKHEGRNK